MAKQRANPTASEVDSKQPERQVTKRLAASVSSPTAIISSRIGNRTFLLHLQIVLLSLVICEDLEIIIRRPSVAKIRVQRVVGIADKIAKPSGRRASPPRVALPAFGERLQIDGVLAPGIFSKSLLQASRRARRMVGSWPLR